MFDEKVSFAKITFEHEIFLVNVIGFYIIGHHAIPCRKSVKHQETLQTLQYFLVSKTKVILFIIL